jgi:hypothetical protein
VLDGRQVIQPLLYEQPDNSVRVEDEVPALGLLVADDTVTTSQIELSSIAASSEREVTHVSNAMSCGVWGSTVTLGNSTSVEMVAMGFWLSER